MNKIMKTLAKISYAAVFLCMFVPAEAAVYIPGDYYLTAVDQGKVEQRYRPYGMYETVRKTVSKKDPYYGGYDYCVWYPKKLEVSDKKWPMVVLLNGTTSSCDIDEPVYEHLASWGFIVVGNTDENTGLGYSAEWGLQIMDKLYEDQESVFYHKIDMENIGIGGHSQGGIGAINTLLLRDSGPRFKTIVTLSAVTRFLAEKLNIKSWEYDPSQVRIPWFMIAGDGPEDRKLITPLRDMEDVYGKAQTSIIMARRSGADHSEIQAEGDAYVTAWFRWQLAGDIYAKRAFTGGQAEILTNRGWNHVKRKGNF